MKLLEHHPYLAVLSGWPPGLDGFDTAPRNSSVSVTVAALEAGRHGGPDVATHGLVVSL
ncbi:MAG: hypothetical protein ACRDJ4_05290 [Actinomycetota bacterium]